MIDKQKQGKKNRKKGSEWEKIVRKDIEAKGWIVSKWQNQVEFYQDMQTVDPHIAPVKGRLIPCRMNFRGKGIPMMLGAGFPDFIAYKYDHMHSILHAGEQEDRKQYFIIGVEAKINGYLTPEERAKCEWLLTNNIFSKILIAFKNKEGKIEYKEYET